MTVLQFPLQTEQLNQTEYTCHRILSDVKDVAKEPELSVSEWAELAEALDMLQEIVNGNRIKSQ